VYALDLTLCQCAETLDISFAMIERHAYLSLILESDLTHSHTSVFLQVTPRRVYNRDIVFLVALDTVGLGKLGAVHQ
jgi:hypothetical protein